MGSRTFHLASAACAKVLRQKHGPVWLQCSQEDGRTWLRVGTTGVLLHPALGSIAVGGADDKVWQWAGGGVGECRARAVAGRGVDGRLGEGWGVDGCSRLSWVGKEKWRREAGGQGPPTLGAEVETGAQNVGAASQCDESLLLGVETGWGAGKGGFPGGGGPGTPGGVGAPQLWTGPSFRWGWGCHSVRCGSRWPRRDGPQSPGQQREAPHARRSSVGAG